MNLDVSGQPAIVVMVALVLACSPVLWIAALVVRADMATLPRSMVVLLLVAVASLTALALMGQHALALTPLIFLLAIRYVLGTTFFGAFGVGFVALIGYAAAANWIGERAVTLPKAMTVWACGDDYPLDRFGCTER